MTIGLDLPACQPSFVQRLDPRWKLAGVLLSALACALLRTAGPSVAALFGALLLVVAARLSGQWYARRLAGSLALFVLFLVWLPLVPEGNDVVWDLGIVSLSLTGLVRLLALSAKLGAMLSLMLVLLATSPIQETMKAAFSLRIPGLLTQIMLLTYRYVFVLMEEFGRLRTALRIRGFRNRANLHSYRTIGQVAGTLLVRSHERSDRVGQAMRCRGFEGRFRSLHHFHTRGVDVLFFAVLVSYTGGLVVWDWIVR